LAADALTERTGACRLFTCSALADPLDIPALEAGV
jgi:hypothetical protein